MKFKVLLVAVVMSIMFAVPVMAQEVTDPTKVYKEEAFNADESILINDFHRGEITRCGNYIKYLDGVIYNLNETVRVKKEVLDNYRYLSTYNSYFLTLIPNAQKDYDEAVVWVDYYKAYKSAVQADFAVRY